ncbi:hypothetical protein [Hymenobacter sp. APR13]|uniref:hypothetical protein n=1 Tax=Hymenobacter sp. APR13 TaxID=1356852 RepID=UPI0012E07043|nr:hypothetical protein [Hymenobacter sp. APR13]
MNLDNVITILDQLVRKTREEKITWEKTSKAKSYKASLLKGIFIVERNPLPLPTMSSVGMPVKVSYTFQIFDTNGEKIYSKSTGNNGLAPSPSSLNINKMVLSLFDAIEDANGNSLKDIMNELINL